MSKYYCHPCASSMGELNNIHSSAPIASTYQIDKYLKHSIRSSSYNIQSIFDNPSTKLYQGAIVKASCAGSVEYDDKGRKNIIVVGSTGRTGCRFQNGKFVRENDMIKVVLSTDPEKIHAFTESSTTYSTALCDKCGQPVVY
jgi:hypothetical protein